MATNNTTKTVTVDINSKVNSDLSNQLKFNYNIITDKEKICKKNKNSLIEIFLFDK